MMKRTILAILPILAALALGAAAKADSVEIFLFPDTVASLLLHPEGTIKYRLAHPRPFDGVFYEALATDPNLGEFPTLTITTSVPEATVVWGITEAFPVGGTNAFVYAYGFDAKGNLRAGGGSCVQPVVCTGLIPPYHDEGYVDFFVGADNITLLYFATDESPFPVGLDSLVTNGPPVVTPEPGALLLVSAGLAGFVLRRRKPNLNTTANLVA
jgi:hypothetical protein